MLNIQDLSCTVGGRNLFSEVNWQINPGSRIALIGPNGSGKTTMLKIIAGELDADSGTVNQPGNYRIAYLPQETLDGLEGPVLATVLAGRPDILRLKKQLDELHVELETGESEKSAKIRQAGELEDRFRALGGYQLESSASKMLFGLGFSRDQLNRQLAEFSGGWRMKVYLARLLLQEPDLLLLDEPTNHLDLPSLEWLERFLGGFPGSIVLVSHDRFFIDRLAREIHELERGKLTRYKGNYRVYEKQKNLENEQLLKKWQEQQNEIKRQKKFIERFRYKATKAAAVQSRIKYLEKMERVEPPESGPELNFSLQVKTPSYKEVLTVEDMTFAYAENEVFANVSLKVRKGEKICLVGRNGAGKTTLTRLISGELVPCAGTLELGGNVTLGYYAQHQVEALNLGADLIDEAARETTLKQYEKVRSVLGLFGFSGDDVFKKVGVLSGGEKARVSLTRILFSGANFLIMDEPTNHLDTRSREALEKALLAYEGTLLLVSHDRYFLNKIVDRVIEIKDGGITDFQGNYTDYLSARDHLDAEAGVSAADIQDNGNDENLSKKDRKRLEALARQAVSARRNTINRQIVSFEKEIEKLEQQKQELEEKLASPETYSHSDQVVALQKEHAKTEQGLSVSYAGWEKAQRAMEELMEELEKKLVAL